MIFQKTTATKTAQLPVINWCGHQFDIYDLNDITFATLHNIEGIFVFSGKNSGGKWVPFYLDLFPYIHASTKSFNKDLKKAKGLGATHIHFAKLNDMSIRNALHDKIIEKYQPVLNQQEDKIMSLTSDKELYSEDLNEIKLKLELLYNHESHYLELIKNYKEEIKFAKVY